jgi:exopolysaccharide biosynthesis polyprenyl glycosylphosphotransferase
MALAEQANPAFSGDAFVRFNAAVSRAGSPRHSTQAMFVAMDFMVIWLTLLAALGLRLTPGFASRLGLPPLDRHAQLAGHGGFLVFYPVLVVLLCNAQGLYRSMQTVSPRGEESWIVCKAVVFATALQTACVCFSGPGFVSRFVIGFTVLMSGTLLVGWRRLRRLRIKKAYANGWSCRNLLIVGSGLQALALRAYLDHNRHLGYVVRGLVACGPENGAQTVETLGSVSDLQALARTHFIDEILISDVDRQVVKRVVSAALSIGLDVCVIPDLYDGLGWGAPVEYIGQFPVIALHQRPRRTAGLIVKRSIDILLSAFALAALSPVFLLVAIVVKLSSPGCVIYASERVGRRGRIFPCYKFRSMVANADALKASLHRLNQRDKVLFKVANDPRVTRVGRFLRKYSLDELPQLWNVLKGDMSLVGPRPPLASEVKQYELEHLRRLDALPGITGLWQVEARSNPSFARYVALDVDYVEHWNPWLDARILLKTVAVVLAGTGE